MKMRKFPSKFMIQRADSIRYDGDTIWFYDQIILADVMSLSGFADTIHR